MKSWNNVDTDFLINNYPNIGAKGCSQYIKKEIKLIISKANRIGLKYENKSKRYEYENLKTIVENSCSLSEVSRKLGLSTGRGNRKTVKIYILKYNLSIKHFKTINNNIKPFTKYDLNNILIVDSTYNNTSNLKNRLYKESLLKPICSICGQNEFWENMKISLILDHINGD